MGKITSAPVNPRKAHRTCENCAYHDKASDWMSYCLFNIKEQYERHHDSERAYEDSEVRPFWPECPAWRHESMGVPDGFKTPC